MKEAVKKKPAIGNNMKIMIAAHLCTPAINGSPGNCVGKVPIINNANPISARVIAPRFNLTGALNWSNIAKARIDKLKI